MAANKASALPFDNQMSPVLLKPRLAFYFAKVSPIFVFLHFQDKIISQWLKCEIRLAHQMSLLTNRMKKSQQTLWESAVAAGYKTIAFFNFSYGLSVQTDMDEYDENQAKTAYLGAPMVIYQLPGCPIKCLSYKTRNKPAFRSLIEIQQMLSLSIALTMAAPVIAAGRLTL